MDHYRRCPHHTGDFRSAHSSSQKILAADFRYVPVMGLREMDTKRAFSVNEIKNLKMKEKIFKKRERGVKCPNLIWTTPNII